jgi:hypothetical protein
MYPTRGKCGLVEKDTGFEAQGRKFPCGITDVASGMLPEKGSECPRSTLEAFLLPWSRMPLENFQS